MSEMLKSQGHRQDIIQSTTLDTQIKDKQPFSSPPHQFSGTKSERMAIPPQLQEEIAGTRCRKPRQPAEVDRHFAGYCLQWLSFRIDHLRFERRIHQPI